jgi:hypothetical protein
MITCQYDSIIALISCFTVQSLQLHRLIMSFSHLNPDDKKIALQLVNPLDEKESKEIFRGDLYPGKDPDDILS